MVTLTLPGDWLTVAPDGLTFPVVLGRTRSVALRGLPFQEWQSLVWAEVVAHPDPMERTKHVLAGTGIDFAKGLRASNPQQVMVYFLKHSLDKASSKAYQNVAPEEWTKGSSGPGRFWGIWGLEDVSAEITLSPEDWAFLSHTIRRYLRAQGVVRRRRVLRRTTRVDIATGGLIEVYRYRAVSRRVRRLSRSAGFVVLEEAPALHNSLASWMRERGGVM